MINVTNGEAQWYTCCEEGEDEVQQTCSDAHFNPVTFSGWAVPDGLAPKSCVDHEPGFVYPRSTGAVIPYDHGDVIYDVEQFLCCQTPSEDVEVDPEDRNGDLLPDDCDVQACTSLDGKGGAGDCWADGVTEPFTCNTKDPNNEFIHPTRNGHDDANLFNFHYVCCKDKTKNYFVQQPEQDELYIALVVQSTISFITFLVTATFSLAILSNAKVRSQAWNIYLVMLSVPDVIYNLYRLIYGVIVITRSNTFISTSWTIDWFYAVTNLFLNAIIVYEVHRFVRAFKQQARRVSSPPLNRVFLQGFSVYVVGAGCGVWMFHLHTVGDNIAGGGNYDRFLQIYKISLCSMVIPPTIFVTLICLDVWYRKLLPETGGRTRTLAIYFLRVIFVFMVTWLPYMVLITYGLRSNRILAYIGMCFSSIQGTLSVLVAMSKSDIYWAVTSLLKGQCNADPPVEQRISKQGNVRVSGFIPSKISPMTGSKRETESTVSEAKSRMEAPSETVEVESSEAMEVEPSEAMEVEPKMEV